MRGLRLAVLAMAAGLVLAGCGGEASDDVIAAQGVETLDASFIPDEILGLEVQPERTGADLEAVTGSYLEAVRLYTLRDSELLQATLQVGRFRGDADYEDAGFRRGILVQLGSPRPPAATVGDKTVYLTTGIKQGVAVWFEDDYLFILGTRQSFDRPRTLLRQVLEIEPA